MWCEAIGMSCVMYYKSCVASVCMLYFCGGVGVLMLRVRLRTSAASCVACGSVSLSVWHACQCQCITHPLVSAIDEALSVRVLESVEGLFQLRSDLTCRRFHHARPQPS